MLVGKNSLKTGNGDTVVKAEAMRGFWSTINYLKTTVHLLDVVFVIKVKIDFLVELDISVWGDKKSECKS